MSRKGKSGNPKAVLSVRCIEPNAAGVDIGAREVWVAVPADRDPKPVRCFETFTPDLREMVNWLKQCRITTVAMESTGVYWIPAYEILEEAGIRVCLVNSQHVKNVPGRKTDISDCQWLQYLHSVGLLRASFRPNAEICTIRALSRHRASLVEVASIHVQHMQKALTQMNLQIHHVLSDITGLSGMAILDAILQGKRDPELLADLCHSGVRTPRGVIIKSLVGNYRPEHVFTLKQSVAAYRYYHELIAECDEEIEQLVRQMEGKDDPPPLSPLKGDGKRRKNQFHFDLRGDLNRIFGTDLTEIPGISSLTAHTLLVEIGPDLSRFPSAEAFVAWLGLCPGNKISGGKVLSSKSRKTNSRVSLALRLSARSLHKSQSHLGGFYRRLRGRLGAPQAVTATAHKLARIVYHLITKRVRYDESVFHMEEHKQAIHREKRLRKQAKALGFELVPLSA